MPKPTIIRSEDEINRVLNWADEGVEDGSKFPGQSYESGIKAMYEWLVGDTEDVPDPEE